MALGAVGSLRIGSSRPDTAQDVLSLRHWLKVVRVDATPVPAQVIQL